MKFYIKEKLVVGFLCYKVNHFLFNAEDMSKFSFIKFRY